MAGDVLKNKEHPLAGVVLCFTSILPEQRSELAAIASEMGATHKFDLTSDVTHLLVGDTNTAKYKYVARERCDVTVLKPEWIEAVRQSWVQGGDTDLKLLEEQYKLPTFYRLSICVTGFDDLSFRNHLQETAIANGAEFRKDLTKSVTHLIAREASGQKYKFATQWNINVVSVKWFTESLDRGMILDEALYHPLRPLEKQGDGAWNRSQPEIIAKRVGPPEISGSRSRKLRRVGSTKLSDQNEGIWGDIVGKGFDASDIVQEKVEDLAANQEFAADSNVTIRECRSPADERAAGEDPTKRRALTKGTTAEQPKGFLDGCYFFPHGFSSKEAEVLTRHLSYNGANVVKSLVEFSTPEVPNASEKLYIIVPHRLPRSRIPSTEGLAFECKLVTEMWLERCLDAQTLVPPESHVTSTPFPCFPIPGFRDLKICSTGFIRIDLLHVSKLVEVMGAEYEEFLTPSVSVLICNDPSNVNAEKIRYALEWDIPTVSADWLWISVQTGQNKPFEQYFIPEYASSRKKDKRESAAKAADRRTDPSSTEPGTEKCKELKADTRASTDMRSGPQNRPDEGPASKNEKWTGSDSLHDRSDQSSNYTPNLTRDTTAFKSPSPTKLMSDESESRKPVKSVEPGKNVPSKTATNALDRAVTGFLRQARALSNLSNNSIPSIEKVQDQTATKRRKPLLGRAGSLSSARNGNGTRAVSRASSIDTLNEDGYGSAIEGSGTADADNKESSKLPTRNGISFNSIISGSNRPELYRDSPFYDTTNDDIDQAPAMTQLDYEDPDAAAMRRELLGQPAEEEATSRGNGSRVAQESLKDVGELRDIGREPLGMARRTRRAGRVKEAEDGFF